MHTASGVINLQTDQYGGENCHQSSDDAIHLKSKTHKLVAWQLRWLADWSMPR
jgi:hypothetical protein